MRAGASPMSSRVRRGGRSGCPHASTDIHRPDFSGRAFNTKLPSDCPQDASRDGKKPWRNRISARRAKPLSIRRLVDKPRLRQRLRNRDTSKPSSSGKTHDRGQKGGHSSFWRSHRVPLTCRSCRETLVHRSGVLVERYAYDPYGRPLVRESTARGPSNRSMHAAIATSPVTFTTVRHISRKRSTPRMIPIPSPGTPTD